MAAVEGGFREDYQEMHCDSSLSFIGGGILSV